MNRRTAVPLAVAMAAALLVVAVIVAPGDRSADRVAAVAVVVALLAVGAGAVRHHLVRPWLTLVVGVACWAIGAIVAAEQLAAGDRVVPGLPEALIALGFPWIAIAVAGITARAPRARELFAGVDGVIVALAVSAVVWVGAIAPVVADRPVPLGVGWWYGTFVVIDLMVAAVVLRAAVVAPAARGALVVLGGAFLAAAAAHAAWWRVLADDPAGTSRLAPAVTAAALLMLAVAALAPPHRAERAESSVRSTVRWHEVIGLALVAAVPLAALGLVTALGDDAVTRASVAVVAPTAVIVIALMTTRLAAMVGQVREVTERHGRKRLDAMVENSDDIVMLADRTGTVTYASPGLASALGYRPSEWVGRAITDVVGDDDRRTVSQRFEALLDAGRDSTIDFESALVRRDGQVRHGRVVMVNLVGDEAVDGVVVTFRDVTEQRDLERKLSHRAFHDELTGLANRALFLDRMDHALRVGRHEDGPVMVLFIDLDDFKQVNDAHGHGVGDEMLRVIADRIRNATASGDTAARIGGDEFAVLLEDDGGIDRALDLADRLLATLEDPVAINGTDVVVLASIGIATAATGASTTSVLRDADIAMYEAKRAGKGQIRVFDPAMRRVAARHLAYRHELSSAIERGQLRVVYLPYVDLRSGEVRGAEALVRWHHPDHGEIEPTEFVPIAERSGLIVPIGRWVVGEALQQMSTWRADADLFVSINVTATEMRQVDLCDHLLAAVRAHDIDPRRLVVEVTETDLMSGGERALRTVEELRSHGFGVALDDFGAGSCSISHLQRHPVDMIKIDRGYVAELGLDGTDPSLARAVLPLAETLDITSAAEGIETPEQLHELRRWGCRLGQGYLLSGALEAPVIARRFGWTGEPVAAGRA